LKDILILKDHIQDTVANRIITDSNYFLLTDLERDMSEEIPVPIGDSCQQTGILEVYF
jgi:hypothetical protein